MESVATASTRELAKRVVEAITVGAVTREMLDELAASVLDIEHVRLALEVQAGGEHAVRRALELAALVLANDVDPQAMARRGG